MQNTKKFQPALGTTISEQQADLLTRLRREAEPIVVAREHAARELGLEAVRDALEEQVILAQPFLPSDTSLEYARLQRQWAFLMLRFDEKVLEDLRSGTLLAFGTRLPVRPSSVPTPIPPGLWYLIGFNSEDCTASGAHWSYQEVRVICVRSMEAPERLAIDRALAILAAKLEVEVTAGPSPPTAQSAPPWAGSSSATTSAAAEKPFGTMRAQASRDRGPRRGTRLNSSLGATEHNPLHISIAAISERVVMKTEMLRRNTRYGKPAPTKVERVEETVGSAEPAGQKPVSEEGRRRPGKSGPRTLNEEIEAHLKERSEKKLCRPTWVEESLHLHAWTKSTFAQVIRAKTRRLAKIKRLREVHADTYYRLNPEFDRRRRFKQESI